MLRSESKLTQSRRFRETNSFFNCCWERFLRYCETTSGIRSKPWNRHSCNSSGSCFWSWNDRLNLLYISRKLETARYIWQVVKDTIELLSCYCLRDLKVEVSMSTRKVPVNLLSDLFTSFWLFLVFDWTE